MIPWFEKVSIGAVGAVCLGLLKLISANFYVGSSNPAVLGVYLTLAAYVFLGMAVACFFAEENKETWKTRQSAFLMGLMAPSILIAIVASAHSPPADANPPAKQDSDVPTLNGALEFFLPSAYAQAPPAPETRAVQVLSRRSVEPSVGDGVKAALGVQALPSEPSVFVVGKTSDKAVAERTASDLNGILAETSSTKGLTAYVVQPEGVAEYYVTVDGPTSAGNAATIDTSVKQAALDALTTSPTAQQKSAAEALAKGRVYKGRVLFEHAK